MNQCPYCEWTTDSVAEEVEHMQLAHPEIIRKRLEAAGMADEADEIDVIKLDDTEEFVMVRLVEWAEWMPGYPDSAAGLINVHNGVTGFSTAKSERLLDVHVLGTGRNLDFKETVECGDCDGVGRKSDEVHGATEAGQTCEVCEGSGTVEKDVHYGYYTFQAVLAQNVSKQLLESLKMAQQMPLLEEFERRRTEGRDKRDDLVIVERKAPPPPPRRKKKR